MNYCRKSASANSDKFSACLRIIDSASFVRTSDAIFKVAERKKALVALVVLCSRHCKRDSLRQKAYFAASRQN